MQDFVLTADSLEVRAPNQTVERVFASGSARSVSQAGDSLSVELLPQIAQSDWLEGDTVIALALHLMREVLLGVATKGLYEPLWSARILEEWALAARKLGPMGEAQARGEIAQLRAAWPRAEVICVTYLGETGHELQGREALEIFTAALETHVFEPVTRAEGYRIDRGLPEGA